MRGYLGNFLQVSGGREYIVQVPGSANARLDDEALAALMNWLVMEMGPNVPANFKPYTAAELAVLRLKWLRSPAETRQHLVSEINRRGLGQKTR